MRIATWNINSVRLRIDLVMKLLDEYAPDILCLQETKVVDDAFPRGAFADRGYIHQHINGMKSYNGVAILSRLPFRGQEIRHSCGKEDCRHVMATLESGLEVHNFYVPAGGDIPDPALNDKFAHKLQYLDEMRDWFAATRSRDRPMVLVGDLNIAPLEHDVWSHKQLLDVVSHTPIEVEKLGSVQAGLDWVDAVRHFVPADQKLYSWWSYRAADWNASNKGRRLDHIWVTPPLAGKLKGQMALREARGWEPKPSDHVPVMVDLDL
ncbi:exodeoxyribonuclease III [Niveispirillum fermenti]|uniref:exodeoxyribonuclease III n=1 Tax=Niveispirillum fermenti TaxID=1233113 RepID=UPI003A887392